jgi:hypothetical protein
LNADKKSVKLKTRRRRSLLSFGKSETRSSNRLNNRKPSKKNRDNLNWLNSLQNSQISRRPKLRNNSKLTTLQVCRLRRYSINKRRTSIHTLNGASKSGKSKARM